MEGVGRCDSRWEERSSSRDGDDGVDVEVTFSTLDPVGRGGAVMFDIVTESSRGRDCQVDVDRSGVSIEFQCIGRLTHLLTSEGSFLSFQTPLLNSPPSIGKSVLSVPFKVHGVPGCKDSRRT